jgi:hypothetical protein
MLCSGTGGGARRWRSQATAAKKKTSGMNSWLTYSPELSATGTANGELRLPTTMDRARTRSATLSM